MEGKCRHFLVPRFPHAIVFAVRADEFVVVAVAHGKRKPDYWRERIES